MVAFYVLQGVVYPCCVCGVPATQWVEEAKKARRDYCDEHGFGRNRPRSLGGLVWREVKLFGSWMRELWLSWVRG